MNKQIDRATDDQVNRAAKAGKAAFHTGNQGIPSQDPVLVNLIDELIEAGLPAGFSVLLIDTWYRGWKHEKFLTFIATCPEAMA